MSPVRGDRKHAMKCEPCGTMWWGLLGSECWLCGEQSAVIVAEGVRPTSSIATSYKSKQPVPVLQGGWAL